jgi:prepilin peptidase CpaA
MTIILTLIVFTSGLIMAAAVTDFLKLKIPNSVSGAIIICFTIAYGTQEILGKNAFQDLSSHLISGGVMLAIMMVLFFLKLFGGGDAKLIPAVALWTGLNGLPLFLMVTTISGGALALVSIALRKTKTGQRFVTKMLRFPTLQNGWIGALAKGENVVPYGIAIAIGAIVSFRHIGYLP